MTATLPLPPAGSSSPWARLRSGIVMTVLFLSLCYSAVVLVQERNSSAEKRALAGNAPTLRALLFQRGMQLDLFDFSAHETTVRSTRALERVEELSIPARLLSSRTVLIRTDRQARVRDMGSPYTYHPISSDSGASLVHVSRNTNFIYFIPTAPDDTSLRIEFAACGEIASIPLPAWESWYNPAPSFSALKLPMQQTMMLSPAETSLALVRHNAFPRITLIQLIERNAITLSVPSFDPEQLHFSPFFIDESTLLFSVLDRNHWGTALYHLPTGTYEILSENFTDHAYHSFTGNVILQQSYFGDETNIPFGSVALLERARAIPVRRIESITGPRETRAGLYSAFFENPEEEALHFRNDLTTESFNSIAESDIRESLRAFWREYQLNLSQVVGVFRLLKLEPDGLLTRVETIPFEIRSPASFARYMEDAEPLLKVLELPPSLIEEYRTRRNAAIAQEDYYFLVDDLSY